MERERESDLTGRIGMNEWMNEWRRVGQIRRFFTSFFVFFSFFFCISGPPFWNTTGPHTQAVPVCKNVPAGSTAAGLFLFFCVFFFLLWQPKKKEKNTNIINRCRPLRRGCRVEKRPFFFVLFILFFIYIFFSISFLFSFSFFGYLGPTPEKSGRRFLPLQKKNHVVTGFFFYFLPSFFLSRRGPTATKKTANDKKKQKTKANRCAGFFSMVAISRNEPQLDTGPHWSSYLVFT